LNPFWLPFTQITYLNIQQRKCMYAIRRNNHPHLINLFHTKYFQYEENIMSIVTGLFKDKDSAERAYREASQSGYSAEEINVVMSEETRERYYGKHATLETEVGNKAAEGASIGGAVGGTLGAIAAAVAAVGTTLLIPGLGIWVAGPVAAAVAGAGAGGVSGGIVGALIGWAIPEDRLVAYEQGIKEGGILLGIKPRSEEDRARFEREWSNPGVATNT
jgi:hypothetical protein